jgi:hypothetical protein
MRINRRLSILVPLSNYADFSARRDSIPLVRPSSDEAQNRTFEKLFGIFGQRAGLVGISSVETVDDFQAVDKCCWFPLWLVVARPFDEILEFSLAAEHSGIQDGIGIPFGFSINFDGRWRWLVLPWVWVVGRGLEEGDVKYGVNSHPLGKF